MYFAYYFIRIIREIFGRSKLQKIIILALLLIALAWCFTKLGSFAYGGLEGDSTYTDGNNSIYMYYDSYLNDLSVRLMNTTGNDVEDLIDRLSNSKLYSFIVMYGQSNLDMNNDFQHLRVVLFQSSSGFNDSTAYNIWHNMPCQYVYNGNSNVIIYDFTDMSCTKTITTGTFYFPYMLINRYNNSLLQVLSNRSGTNSSDIVGAINSQTTEIQNQTTAIESGNSILQDTQDFIEDDNIDNAQMTIDTSGASIEDNTGVYNFFTSFLQTVQNTLTDYNETSVSYIRIPLYRGQYLTIPSNAISKYIVNTDLAPLITVFWTFIFGGYIVSYVYRMIQWLSTGQIFNEGGVADFIWYLDTENEIIKGYMM